MTSLPRGRHQLSRAEVIEDQRARMIRAMAEAMTATGYIRTPVADIIKRAGVSRETFYEQFSSKQDCFIAALEQTIGQLAFLLTAMASDDGEPIDQYDRLVGAYLTAVAADPSTARLFLVEIYTAGPEVAVRRMELQQQFIDRLVTIFRARSKADRFACEALVAATISMVTTRVVADDVDGLPALRKPLVELARRTFS